MISYANLDFNTPASIAHDAQGAAVRAERQVELALGQVGLFHLQLLERLPAELRPPRSRLNYTWI